MKYLFACDYLLINKLIIAAAWVVEYNKPILSRLAFGRPAS